MALILRTLVTMTKMTMAQARAMATVRVSTTTMTAVLLGPPEPLLDDDWTCGFDTPVTVSRSK